MRKTPAARYQCFKIWILAKTGLSKVEAVTAAESQYWVLGYVTFVDQKLMIELVDQLCDNAEDDNSQMEH